MAEFLSVAWIAELDGVARSLPPGAGPPERLVIEQQVTGPRGVATYQFHVSGTEIRVHAGAPTHADVVLATDLQSAAAFHGGPGIVGNHSHSSQGLKDMRRSKCVDGNRLANALQ